MLHILTILMSSANQSLRYVKPNITPFFMNGSSSSEEVEVNKSTNFLILSTS